MNFAWRLDPLLLRLTGGRVSSAGPLAAALLESRGARTGLPRRNATLYFHDGETLTIVASKRGWPTHPAWYYNLRPHPDDVVFGGLPFRAVLVDDETETRASVGARGSRLPRICLLPAACGGSGKANPDLPAAPARAREGAAAELTG